MSKEGPSYRYRFLEPARDCEAYICCNKAYKNIVVCYKSRKMLIR
ncbi:MAG: hypothetical protein ACOX24_05385 [Christensenellales bacterium]